MEIPKMTGGGVIAVPLLCIFGYYWFQRPYLKFPCLILALGWMIMCAAIAIVKSEWSILTFPAILGIGWAILHPILKNG